MPLKQCDGEMCKGLDEGDVIIGRLSQTQSLDETVKDGFKDDMSSNPGSQDRGDHERVELPENSTNLIFSMLDEELTGHFQVSKRDKLKVQ